MDDGDLVAREPEDTDTTIEKRVLELLVQATQELRKHSMRSDYQQTVGGMAVRSLLDAVRSVEHLADRETRMYKAGTENGPQVGYKSGPKRFRVNVKLMRPAIYLGLDSYGKAVEHPFDGTEVKKHERPRYYDTGYAAAEEARSYAFRIGEWVESVKVYDRLEHILWTYDAEGDTAELDIGPE